jgi:uncharacterized membrane protein
MKLLDQNNSEKEVSGGAVFGYILLAAAAVVVIAFLVFVCIQKIGGSKETSDTETSRIESVTDIYDFNFEEGLLS